MAGKAKGKAKSTGKAQQVNAKAKSKGKANAEWIKTPIQCQWESDMLIYFHLILISPSFFLGYAGYIACLKIVNKSAPHKYLSTVHVVVVVQLVYL